MTSQLDPNTLIKTMANAIQQRVASQAIEEPIMIGIHTGGAWVAEKLHKTLGLATPLGTLNISFYRDDFSKIGLNPTVKPSSLPPDVTDRNIILVDDVLYTGRTIRAALNEVFDFGRPASIMLAVLIDRGGRELPIQADIVGAKLELAENEHIKLSGPDPLSLHQTTT